MDARIRDFVADIAQTLVGIDVALFYQANPRAFDTPAGIALRTHRNVDEVNDALERMAAGGYLEAFPRGEGRYTCYALPKSAHIWNTLCLLSEAYIDQPESRKEIIRLIMELRAAAKQIGKKDKSADE